jgi:translation initiation factor 2B subunit (eIF-2B alpha/beta/delta family)
MKEGEKTRLNRILEDIKSIKIQGAENVAKAGIKAFLIDPTKSSAKKILKTRPTEPLMQNAIKILLKSKRLTITAKNFLKTIKKSHETIAKKGSMLIKNDMNIYTHCHSSTVIDILKYANKKRKKHFVVYTSEVEPLLQGRTTANDLAKAKIKVIISPDLAAEQSLKKCDLFLFGADAFTKNIVANKIGTSTLTRLAKLHNIPRYACGVSTKFTNKIRIEKRPSQEVWDRRHNKIKVINPAFDKTKMKDLSGVISEFGILTPKQFVKKAKEKLKQPSKPSSR